MSYKNRQGKDNRNYLLKKHDDLFDVEFLNCLLFQKT
jgi:hypothetical protein